MPIYMRGLALGTEVHLLRSALVNHGMTLAGAHDLTSGKGLKNPGDLNVLIGLLNQLLQEKAGAKA